MLSVLNVSFTIYESCLLLPNLNIVQIVFIMSWSFPSISRQNCFSPFVCYQPFGRFPRVKIKLAWKFPAWVKVSLAENESSYVHWQKKLFFFISCVPFCCSLAANGDIWAAVRLCLNKVCWIPHLPDRPLRYFVASSLTFTNCIRKVRRSLDNEALKLSGRVHALKRDVWTIVGNDWDA